MRCHLEPAPRPATEVDHALTGAQQALRALDLVELVGRARAEALAFRTLMEAILAVVGGRGGGPYATVLRTRTRALRWPGTEPRT